MGPRERWKILDKRHVIDIDQDGGSIVERLRFEVKCPEGHVSIVRTTFDEDVLKGQGDETLGVPCRECGETYGLKLGPWPPPTI